MGIGRAVVGKFEIGDVVIQLLDDGQPHSRQEIVDVIKGEKIFGIIPKHSLYANAQFWLGRFISFPYNKNNYSPPDEILEKFSKNELEFSITAHERGGYVTNWIPRDSY